MTETECSTRRLPSLSRDVVGFLLFIGSMAFLLSFWRYGMNWWDEGVHLHGAQRIANGDVMYRDFYTQYGPGRYYLLAFLFNLFESSLFVARVLWYVLLSVCAVMAYRLVGRLVPRWLAALTGAYFVLVPAQHYKVYFTLCCLVVIFAAVKAVEGGRRRHWLIAGLAIGVCGLFRYENVPTGAIVCLTLLFTQERLTGRICTREMLLRGALFLLGAAVIIAPMAGYYLAVADVARTYEYWMIHKIQHLKYFSVPFPLFSQEWQKDKGLYSILTPHGFWLVFDGLAVYLPTLLCAGTLGLVGLRILRKKRRGSDALLLACGLIGLMIQPFFYSRADFDHFLHVTGPMYLLLFIMLGSAIGRLRQPGLSGVRFWPTLTVATGCTLYAVGLGVTVGMNHPEEGGTIGKYWVYDTEVIFKKGRYYDTQARAEGTEFIKKFVERVRDKAGENVPKDGIVIFRFGSFWYYMLDLKNPTFQELLVTIAINGDASAEKRLVDSLRNGPVRYLILEQDIQSVANIETFSEMYPNLYKFITNTKECERLEKKNETFTIYRRQSAATKE